MHSQNLKQQVFNQIRTGSSTRDVARMFNIPYKTIWRWVHSADDPAIRQEGKKRNYYSIQDKIDVLQLIDAGKFTAIQVSALKNIRLATIEHWIADKKHIYALYSLQRQSRCEQAKTACPGEEISAMNTTDKDVKRHIRDLRDENEFLKAKVAYLETLMELNGTPVSSFKKKRNTKPLPKSLDEESET